MPDPEERRIRVSVAARDQPARTVHLGLLQPRMQPIAQACLEAAKNKRLITIRKKASPVLTLPDGRMLNQELLDNAPEELALLIALAPGAAAVLPEDFALTPLDPLGVSGRLALWHRPGDKHFGLLGRAGVCWTDCGSDSACGR